LITPTNPIGNPIQLQLQDQFNIESYDVEGYSNAAIVRPVSPFKKTKSSLKKS
jgi:hypothetical protein